MAEDDFYIFENMNVYAFTMHEYPKVDGVVVTINKDVSKNCRNYY